MTTDFPSKHRTAAQAPDRSPRAQEFRRLASDTQALSITAAHAIAEQTLASLRGLAHTAAPNDDAAALLDHLRTELRAAEVEASAGGRAAQRAQHRFFCDKLRLYRVCGRQRCRKAQACTGNAIACFQQTRCPSRCSTSSR